MSGIIPIVFISDDNYALATSVAIESIICNKNKNSYYKIYILGINISDRNKCILESQNKDKVEIQVINKENKYNNFACSHSYITKSSLYKFEIANLFQEYNKVLYLDGDIIVNYDLTELFNTDLADNYAGAVKDLFFYYEKHQHHNFNIQSYFNSGVLLLNLQKIRKDNLFNKFLELRNNNDYKTMDQDVFNVAFNNRIKFLSLKNNFINLYYAIDDFEDFRLKNAIESKYNFSDFEIYSKEEFDDYQRAGKNPLIIHYAGDKPWNFKKGQKFNVWKKYLKKSPYKYTKLKWQKDKKLFEFSYTKERFIVRFCGIGINCKIRRMCKNA